MIDPKMLADVGDPRTARACGATRLGRAHLSRAQPRAPHQNRNSKGGGNPRRLVSVIRSMAAAAAGALVLAAPATGTDVALEHSVMPTMQ
jgi:hypothetical protein